RSLAAVRLGLGDVQGATAALSDAFRHGNLTWLLGGNRLHWVLLLFAVLGVLLWAEGRTTPPTPAPHQKQPPAPGPILLVLAAALLVSIAAALLYGNLVLSNSAALFTPVQGDTVKAVYVAVLGLTLALFSLPLLKGTDTGTAAAEQPVLHGFGLGRLLIVLTVAFLNWLPAALTAPWQLNLSRISVYTVAAVLLLPFAGTYFRALLLPVLGTRRGSSPGGFPTAGAPRPGAADPQPHQRVHGRGGAAPAVRGNVFPGAAPACVRHALRQFPGRVHLRRPVRARARHARHPEPAARRGARLDVQHA